MRSAGRAAVFPTKIDLRTEREGRPGRRMTTRTIIGSPTSAVGHARIGHATWKDREDHRRLIQPSSDPRRRQHQRDRQHRRRSSSSAHFAPRTTFCIGDRSMRRQLPGLASIYRTRWPSARRGVGEVVLHQRIVRRDAWQRSTSANAAAGFLRPTNNWAIARRHQHLLRGKGRSEPQADEASLNGSDCVEKVAAADNARPCLRA